jgi:hypothetical protein
VIPGDKPKKIFFGGCRENYLDFATSFKEAIDASSDATCNGGSSIALEIEGAHTARPLAHSKLAESSEASEQTIMSIAGHVSINMLPPTRTSGRRPRERLWPLLTTSQLSRWKGWVRRAGKTGL